MVNINRLGTHSASICWRRNGLGDRKQARRVSFGVNETSVCLGAPTQLIHTHPSLAVNGRENGAGERIGSTGQVKHVFEALQFKRASNSLPTSSLYRFMHWQPLYQVVKHSLKTQSITWICVRKYASCHGCTYHPWWSRLEEKHRDRKCALSPNQDTLENGPRCDSIAPTSLRDPHSARTCGSDETFGPFLQRNSKHKHRTAQASWCEVLAAVCILSPPTSVFTFAETHVPLRHMYAKPEYICHRIESKRNPNIFNALLAPGCAHKERKLMFD